VKFPQQVKDHSAAEEAGACLWRAGGEYPANKARQYQAQSKPDPDAHWISYIAEQ